jgi:hypothetical protein
MFLTTDANEVRISSLLVGLGARCWRAVQLDLPIPVFLPTWVVQDDEAEISERALLAYESDLPNLFKDVGFQSLRHLQYLSPVESDPDRWQIRDVRKVWSAFSADADQTSHLDLEDESGALFTHFGVHAAFNLQDQIWPVVSR